MNGRQTRRRALYDLATLLLVIPALTFSGLMLVFGTSREWWRWLGTGVGCWLVATALRSLWDMAETAAGHNEWATTFQQREARWRSSFDSGRRTDG